MQHCTPEQLALAALREPLPAADSTHLAECARCRAEVASLRRGVEAVAVPQLAAPSGSVAPPPRVWAAVVAATGVTMAAPPAPPADEPETAQVLPLRSRRRPLLLAAAAVLAGAVIGAGTVAVLDQRDDAEAVEAVEAVALDPLAGNDASGRATVVLRDDGSRALRIDLDALALDEGYYEVWLIEPAVVDMVPLGIARPGSQTFELPAGLDLGEFPLVDVSVEPLDGDPAHSGDSVTRGELDS